MWEVTGWQVYAGYYCGKKFVMITVVELNLKSTVRSIDLYMKIKFMPPRNYRFYRNGILANLFSYACKCINFERVVYPYLNSCYCLICVLYVSHSKYWIKQLVATHANKIRQ